ncbi:MAG: Pilus assembly protein PilP [Pseudomonadota bacterium]|jgi:Tfp pilus assembly protein PilP
MNDRLAFSWTDATQWRAWLTAPWSVESVRWRWGLWHVLPTTVVLAWCVLRLGPMVWQVPVAPAPMPTLSEAEVTTRHAMQQAIAQSESTHAAWTAAVALAPELAFQKLQTLARALDLQAGVAQAESPPTAFKREMAWVGSWDKVTAYLRQMTQHAPSVWLGRVALSAQPGAGVALRLQLEASMPSPAWPVRAESQAVFRQNNPFEEHSLAQRLLRQAAQGPHAPGPQRSPWQDMDPQALRLLGLGGHTPQPWAVLGHQAQVFSVQLGDKVGWHRGWVKAIHADRLEIQEHVLGPDDVWQTRLRVLHFAGQGVQP